MDRLVGRPVLIEFWDFCRPNSMRTLPYFRAWHQRYGGSERGLQVIGIHSPGFPPGRDPHNVASAVSRLGIEYPVLLDSELEMWREYENLGWPARYLFDARGRLFDYHYGEGAYAETEFAIQALLARSEGRTAFPDPLAPVRREDEPDARLLPQTEDQEGLYEGRYESGGVWVVLDGSGTLQVRDSASGISSQLEIEHPGAYPVVEHERHTASTLQMSAHGALTCIATCFTPGLA